MRDDGGPVFPPGSDIGFMPGMTLRQWYKGMAIMGQAADSEPCEKLAAWAGELADALIAEDREVHDDSK